MKIADFLLTGAINAKTGSEIASMLGLPVRTVTRMIEFERRNGAQICSNGQGYYLADSLDDVVRFCNGLKHRATEIYITRSAMLSTMKDCDGQQKIE